MVELEYGFELPEWEVSATHEAYSAIEERLIEAITSGQMLPPAGGPHDALRERENLANYYAAAKEIHARKLGSRLEKKTAVQELWAQHALMAQMADRWGPPVQL